MTDKIIVAGARSMMAFLFLLSGIGKLAAPVVATEYMTSNNIPAFLLWPTVLFEIGGALVLIAGYRIRTVALALAGFTTIVAAIFHHDLADKIQLTMMLKNIAIAGGLILLACAPSRVEPKVDI